MTLPLRTTSTPPPPLRKIPRGDCADDYSGIEDLDRSELDDAPDTEREEHAPPTLPSLEWDEKDGESGVKQRRSI